MQFGLFLKCPSPEMVEACALAGHDYCVIDMEHTPLGPRDLLPLRLASAARGFEPIVRLPGLQEAYFKWALDVGFKRIQVPNVSGEADAREAIRLSRFNVGETEASRGERGLCRFVRAANFGTTPGADYLTGSNTRVELILQIEGSEGLKNVGAILGAVRNVPGVSLFVGPYDLSQSLGIPGEISNPRVTDAMDRIIKEAKSAGVKVGTFTDTPEGIRRWRAAGVDFLEYASDLHVFIQAAKALVTQ